MESVYLLGSEDVRRASGCMYDAAETMIRAASQIDESLRMHQRFLDDWLSRLEAAFADATQPRVESAEDQP